jgi:hypothetical protein
MGCYLRARTLLYALYVIISLDIMLLFAWLGSGFYIWNKCPENLEFHVLFAVHFQQLVSILAVITDWRAHLSEEPFRISKTTPSYWILGSIVAFGGDLFLLAMQINAPEPSPQCRFRKIHVGLDGTGLVTCSISILWFLFVAISTRRSQAKEARLVKEALAKPENAMYNASLAK